MMTIPIWVFVILCILSYFAVSFLIWVCVCKYLEKKDYEEYIEEEYGEKNEK